MKLISCHIENFGTLSDFTLRFREDLQVIFEKNGFGKSTLSTFLTVMFYGFDGEKKKSPEERERVRFKPWNKGAYGGSVTFEVHGKVYELSRFFGSKEAEDSFSLRDAATNLPADDFGPVPGEGIFSLDRASFLRTMMISQNQVMRLRQDGKSISLNSKDGMTSGINARIGSISEEADLGDYEKADALLKDTLNRYSLKRSTGRLYEMNSRMTELRAELNTYAAVEAKLQETSETLERMKAGAADKRKELQAIRAEEKKLAEKKAAQANRAYLERLNRSIEERKNNLNEIQKAYSPGLPKDGELEKVREDLAERNRLSELLSAEKLSEKEQEEYENYRVLFEKDEKPKEEAFRRLQQGAAFYDARKNLKDARETYERESRIYEAKKPGKQGTIILFFGILVAVLGIAILVMRSIEKQPFELGIYVAFAGMLAAFFGAFFTKRERDRLKKEIMNRGKELTLAVEAAYTEEQALKQSLQTYLSLHHVEFSEENLEDDLHLLYEKAVSYERIREELSRFSGSGNREKQAQYETSIRSFLKKYGQETVVSDVEIMELLSDFRRAKALKAQLSEELSDLSEERMRFLMEHTPEELREDTPGTGRTQQELERAEADCAETLNNLEENFRKQEKRYEELLADADRKASCEEELRELQETFVKTRENYALVKQARAFLSKAREQLNTRYSKPVLQAFREHMDEVMAGEGARYHMDAELHLTRDELGEQRETDILSQGLQDLAGFAYRISLVDVMFENEKPFLVLDDPFVNLDEEKTETALRLMKKLSGTYQILYFTCHPSRLPEEETAV